MILEVLDARDPLGCRCPQVEQAVIQSGTNKKIVLVLNKIGKLLVRDCILIYCVKYSMLNLFAFALIKDLVSKEIVEKWIKYLRNEFPTLAFKASTQQQNKNLVWSLIFIFLLYEYADEMHIIKSTE